MKPTLWALLGMCAFVPLSSAEEADVVIYGGTSAGVMAAVQVQRMGHTAVLIEPSSHLGGLTSGGLGATDIGNKRAIGGLSREFYRRVHQHYAQPTAWNLGTIGGVPQRAAGDRGRHDVDLRAPCRRTDPPHLRPRSRCHARRGRASGFAAGSDPRRNANRRHSHGERPPVPRQVFIDATYEGDLLAGAGVSFHVGREASSVYDESLNGVRTDQAKYHQLQSQVDPVHHAR